MIAGIKVSFFGFQNKYPQFVYRFTYQVVVGFDKKTMDSNAIHSYQHWNGLNRIYGAINIIKDLAHDLKAIVEFEPGIYNHNQMKAIRDEYVKLPGIQFGWVMGKKAIQV